MTTEQKIEELEARLDRLSETQAELTRQLVRAEVEHWQARIDDLEVQMHLGAMEADDKLANSLQDLRGSWSHTRRQLEDLSTTTTGAAETLRAGFAKAYADVREAVLESRRKVGSLRH